MSGIVYTSKSIETNKWTKTRQASGAHNMDENGRQKYMAEPNATEPATSIDIEHSHCCLR